MARLVEESLSGELEVVVTDKTEDHESVGGAVTVDGETIGYAVADADDENPWDTGRFEFNPREFEAGLEIRVAGERVGVIPSLEDAPKPTDQVDAETAERIAPNVVEHEVKQDIRAGREIQSVTSVTSSDGSTTTSTPSAPASASPSSTIVPEGLAGGAGAAVLAVLALVAVLLFGGDS